MGPHGATRLWVEVFPSANEVQMIAMKGEKIRVFGMRLGWAAVVVWFSANLLSQAVYIGFNGQPYNANALLSSLGGWYWAFIGIELLIWTLLSGLVVHKLRIGLDDVASPETV